MNDTLLGVLVGGLIGWITPLLTLRYSERRWQFEAKLNHLKSERDKFESLYERAVAALEERDDEKLLSIKLLADITVLMPEEVRTAFDLYIESSVDDNPEAKVKYLEFIVAMKNDLKQRDSAIDALFQK